MLVSKSVHRSFKRNAWHSSSLLSHSATISADFHSKKLWRLLFLGLNPDLVRLVWGWDPSFLMGGHCS